MATPTTCILKPDVCSPATRTKQRLPAAAVNCVMTTEAVQKTARKAAAREAGEAYFVLYVEPAKRCENAALVLITSRLERIVQAKGEALAERLKLRERKFIRGAVRVVKGHVAINHPVPP